MTVNIMNFTNCPVSGNGIYVLSGYTVPADFFTCKTKNGGDPIMFLEDNSSIQGKIIYYNDNFNSTLSDGYSWGLEARINSVSTTNVGAVSVSARNSWEPFVTTDVYAAMQKTSSYIVDNFQYLKADNSFRSGPGSLKEDWGYNCIAWSVGLSADSLEHLPATYWPFYFTFTDWENFYYSHGTINSPSAKGNDLMRSAKVDESTFSPFDLNMISSLIDKIPDYVKTVFIAKFIEWKHTWRRPEIAIHSNPFKYAESEEYNNLVEYCKKYGKSIWPLLFDKLAEPNIFVISLLKDLTYKGNPNFAKDIMPSVTVEVGKPYWR